MKYELSFQIIEFNSYKIIFSLRVHILQKKFGYQFWIVMIFVNEINDFQIQIICLLHKLLIVKECFNE